MKRQAEANVNITEINDSILVDTIVDYRTGPLEFHRANMGFCTKSNMDPTTEDPAKTNSINVDRSLNTLYGIGALQNAGELNCTIEVLALLRWSKDQALHLRNAGTTLYEAFPTVPSHGDPLVITLLLGGHLQPHLLVDEGSAVNILFKCAIEDLKVKEHFAPPAYPIVGFGNNRTKGN